MTKDQLEEVNFKRQEVQFNAGETIFKSGGPLSHIICLTNGLVKVHIEDQDKKILLKIAKPGEIILGPGFLVDDRHYITATAIEESSACYINAEDIKDVMKNNALFSMELVKLLNRNIITYYEKMSGLAHKHMHGKLADTLLYLSEDVYMNDKFVTMLNRQDLADMSAMTKESVIRILKEFKEEGIISYNTTHFEILNKESLHRISLNG
jgi:CRP/FNR family transcriptional regulator